MDEGEGKREWVRGGVRVKIKESGLEGGSSDGLECMFDAREDGLGLGLG